jgi:MraZ protein
MQVLLGEFDCTMDAKGRIRVPSGLLKQLADEGQTFVMNKGFEKHLILYPQSIWDKTVKSFESLNVYDNDTRNFLRRFHNGASQIDIDDQSRILIPKRLAEYAGIEKDVILNAFGDKIEIWDAALYEQFMNDKDVDMSALAQKVLGDKSKE